MATGFFGKLPARGDFVARGLPVGARPVVDRWLTQTLANLARNPDNWPADGVRGLIGHGDGTLALLVLPSRDTSGRAFPLAAVAPAAHAAQAQVDAWADLALPALTRASQGDLDADDLFGLLQALAPSRGTGPMSPPLVWSTGQPPQDPGAFLRRMISSG